jgi:hypothetical protein
VEEMVGRIQPLGRHMNLTLAQFGKDVLHLVLLMAGFSERKVHQWFRLGYLHSSCSWTFVCDSNVHMFLDICI